MRIEDEFKFGKYKGVKLIDVYTGILSNQIKSTNIISNYLNELLNFFTCENYNGKPILAPFLDFDKPKINNLIKKIDLFFDVKFIVSSKYIVIDNCADEILNECMSFLIEIMNLDYKNIRSSRMLLKSDDFINKDLITNSESITNYSYDFFEINANPTYIKWCIENLDKFVFLDDIEILLNRVH